MKRLITKTIILVAILVSTAWSQTRYGETLCKEPDYFCIKIKNGQSWNSLFPNDEEKDIVRRVNRMNITLRAGMVIAVPRNIDRLTIYDVSPFPRYIEPEGEKTIYISQKKLAWGAYDEDGELLWWGPISSGEGKCPGVIGGCSTPSGAYRIIRKQDIDCISTAFPRRADGNNGGAEMPFCMHFFRGYALHGSETVPGYRASHGCIRMFTEDARWLNEEFVELPGGGMKGTRVIIDSVDD
ncbi:MULTISPECIES: L,D-transpeptidase [Legionella]|uniref:L,D-transpeptidase n=1 Tax=Legionella TaxID=445 RepID=UPI001E3C68D1|nr:L,D-transpeptidase [Legionella sp. 31fI33]MCC5015925.1 L,D-transpeptidase [Legionella sp. 31fI33]